MFVRIAPLAVLAAIAVAVPLAASGCGSREGDPASNKAPTPLGSGSRVRDVVDPTLANHPANNQTVSITGASYLWTDTYAETGKAASKGTVFVQDLGSSLPYSGVSIYQPTYAPASFMPTVGDVLDLAGAYQENSHIGTAIFPPPAVLPQLSQPVVKPRFEAPPVPAAAIDLNDLNDYAQGRRWLSMLVTIEGVTFPDSLVDDGSGRNTVHLATNGGPASQVTMSNELFDLAAWNAANGSPIAAGAKVKSITGIVTWFYSYHVAPRSAADIVVQ